MTGVDDDRLRAAIGPGTAYYLEQFEKIDNSGTRWPVTWNWPAFFASTGWFVYRRMGRAALLNFFLPAPFIALLLAFREQGTGLIVMGSYAGLAFLVVPMYANAYYYRHLNARVARAAVSAEAEQDRASPRAPSSLTGIAAFMTGALAFLVPAALLTVPAAYGDYTPRATVSAGLALASSLKHPIAEFYAEHNRLPAPQEAGRFRDEGGKYAQNVAAYDAERRMIVVTIGADARREVRGRRVALQAEEKDGTIYWRCRAIDLDPKYLPASCRE